MNIKELSQKTAVPSSTIRYYERIGLIFKPARDVHGNRVFNESDVEWLLLIKQMRDVHVSVEALAQYRQLVTQGDATIAQRIELLSQELAALKETRAQLDLAVQHLTEKVTNYQAVVLPVEKRGH